MPDAPGLELIRGEVEQDHPGAVLETSFDRGQAAIVVDPAQVLSVLRWLRDAPGQGYRFLSSLHVADYLPADPPLRRPLRASESRPGGAAPGESDAGGSGCGCRGIGGACGRCSGSVLGPPDPTPTAERRAELPVIDSCVELFPTAEFQEREAFDFFGIVFRGHPDLTRILLPDDYVGWPQRRDFPVGGEPVTFTYNEGSRG